MLRLHRRLYLGDYLTGTGSKGFSKDIVYPVKTHFLFSRSIIHSLNYYQKTGWGTSHFFWFFFSPLNLRFVRFEFHRPLCLYLFNKTFLCKYIFRWNIGRTAGSCGRELWTRFMIWTCQGWPSIWKSIRNNVLKRAEFNQAKTIIYIHFDELIISLILFLDFFKLEI